MSVEASFESSSRAELQSVSGGKLQRIVAIYSYEEHISCLYLQFEKDYILYVGGDELGSGRETYFRLQFRKLDEIPRKRTRDFVDVGGKRYQVGDPVLQTVFDSEGVVESIQVRANDVAVSQVRKVTVENELVVEMPWTRLAIVVDDLGYLSVTESARAA